MEYQPFDNFVNFLLLSNLIKRGFSHFMYFVMNLLPIDRKEISEFIVKLICTGLSFVYFFLVNNEMLDIIGVIF